MERSLGWAGERIVDWPESTGTIRQSAFARNTNVRRQKPHELNISDALLVPTIEDLGISTDEEFDVAFLLEGGEPVSALTPLFSLEADMM